MRHVSDIRESQRHVYNWAVEKLRQDHELTWFDLQEFKARRAKPWLGTIERIYQYTVIHEARTAADASNIRGSGNLKFRSRKQNHTISVTCDVSPRFVDNSTASLPGLGAVRLLEEQPYQYPHHWLHGARSFRLVDVTPKSWSGDDHTYRPYITYDLPEPEPIHTGVVAGVDRGITNPTMVCKTDGDMVSFTCHDTAVGFRKNQSWNDGGAPCTVPPQQALPHHQKTEAAQRSIQPAHQRAGVCGVAARQRNMSWSGHGLRGGAPHRCKSWRGNAGKRGLNHALQYIRHGAILRKVGIVAERMGIRVV